MAVYQEDADGNLVLIVPDLSAAQVAEMQEKAKESLAKDAFAKLSTPVDGE